MPAFTCRTRIKPVWKETNGFRSLSFFICLPKPLIPIRPCIVQVRPRLFTESDGSLSWAFEPAEPASNPRAGVRLACSIMFNRKKQLLLTVRVPRPVVQGLTDLDCYRTFFDRHRVVTSAITIQPFTLWFTNLCPLQPVSTSSPPSSSSTNEPAPLLPHETLPTPAPETCSAT